MSVAPNKVAVERCVKGMGFEMKEDAVVLEEKKGLSLGYYSNGLV